jgi:hypothetical protein
VEDWATETHAVCVLNAAGRIKTQFMIDHTAAGFADLLRRLGRLTGDPADVPVGIERPDGRLVDAPLEAGFPVVPVSPNAIKTWRDGEVPSGAKSDAGDATVIAEYLRLRIICGRRPRTPRRPKLVGFSAFYQRRIDESGVSRPSAKQLPSSATFREFQNRRFRSQPSERPSSPPGRPSDRVARGCKAPS